MLIRHCFGREDVTEQREDSLVTAIEAAAGVREDIMERPREPVSGPMLRLKECKVECIKEILAEVIMFVDMLRAIKSPA